MATEWVLNEHSRAGSFVCLWGHNIVGAKLTQVAYKD